VSDFLRDSVRGLIGHAKLALKLFRGDSASSACHQIHRIKPQMQGRRGLVEDSSRSWGQMLSASLTRPSLTLLRMLVAFEFALGFALRTMRVKAIFRVPIAPKKLKASIVIRELAHELHERILGLRRLRSFRLFSINWWHSEDMLHELIIQSRDNCQDIYPKVSRQLGAVQEISRVLIFRQAGNFEMDRAA
jgi:hypothetical protein